MRPKIIVREEKNKNDQRTFVNPTSDHPLWQKEVVIPRAFRWTLHPKNHPDVSWWLKRLSTNYLNKVIEMEVYDDAEGKVYDWIVDTLQYKDNNELDLRHLDAENKSIYLISFSDLCIIDHLTEYDYKLSSVLTHKLKISYKSMKRQRECA